MRRSADDQAHDTFHEMRRKILSCAGGMDDFLSRIAGEHTSHSFLGRSTQAVYLRQVELLRELVKLRFEAPLSAIRVLDWGCGKGHISYLLDKEGFDVTTCDRTRALGDSAFGQPTPILIEKEIRVVPLDAPVALPFANESFDVVVSFGVLEHVDRDAESMREIRRILRPGGIFFVTFLPYVLSWTQWVARLRGNDYHDRLYSKRSFRALARGAGFDVLGIWHGQLFPKNSAAHSPRVEKLDRFLTEHTLLRYFATNLEAVALRPDG